MRFLACFRDHAFITGQQIAIFPIQQVLAEEGPENLRPGNDSVVKTLDRSVTATFFRPARQSEHRYSSGDCKHGGNNTAQLPEGCPGKAVLYRL